MGRKLTPIFSKYDSTTQTSLASTVYDGQPGEPVELHHVVYPTVRPIQPKGGKSKGRKAQSAHVPAPYKKSGAYSKFKVKSQKLKSAQVDGLIDRFGRLLDEKKKKVTEARKKIVSQEDSQVPGQNVGFLVDERTLYVDVVEVVGYQPPATQQSESQPLNNAQLESQTYIRGPGGFLPVSGQWQSSVTGSQVDETSTGGASFQVDSGFSSTSGTSSQVDIGLPSTSGTSTFEFVPPSVEAVSSAFGVELTPEEETTVVSVGELARALPFAGNPTLASTANPGSPEPVPKSWLSGQPDFQTIRDLELLDPFVEPWDVRGFELDVGRLDRAHPLVFSGDVTEEVSNLPCEQTDSGEDQGIGWGRHLGQEFWDIRPLLCDDGSP